MARTIECGFCGQVLELPDDVAPLTACPACGWMIATDAHATPQAAEAETSEDTSLAFPPLYVPDPARPGDAPSHIQPAIRARWLAWPWGEVRESLLLARQANRLGIILVVGLLVVGLIVIALASEWFTKNATYTLVLLGIVALFIAIMHTVAQFGCGQTPASHGGILASIAGFAALFAGVSLLLLLLMQMWFPALALFVVLGLVSWGAWLGYLFSLGTALRDRELTAATGWYGVCYVGGMCVSIALTAGAMYKSKEGDFGTTLLCEWLSTLVSLGLSLGYHWVLAVAADAIARRAPLTEAALGREAELASANRRPWLGG